MTEKKTTNDDVKTPGKPISAPTKRSWLMRLSDEKGDKLLKEVTNSTGGLCRVLSQDKTLYLLSERGHTERRPRNANCFVRRARRGK